MRRIAVLIGLVAGLALPSSVAAGGADTLWVDDDGRAGPVHGCAGSRTTFRRIQPAIDASGRGDTVLVCPGRYLGFLIGTPNVTVRSVEHWRATLLPTVIIQGKTGQMQVVRIAAPRARLEGFRLVSTRAAPCFPMPIIVADRASGWIEGNKLVDRHEPGGCTRYAEAIHVFQTPWLVISGNLIRGFEGPGVTVSGFLEEGGVTTARVVGNRIERLSPSPPVHRGAAGVTVHGDSRSRRTDVVVTVTDNLIYGALGAEWAYGIDSFAADVDARRNVIDGARVGIRFDSGGGVVARNFVTDGVVGIRLLDAVAKFFRNRVRGYDGPGIRVDGDGSANVISDNDFRGNGGIDCVDRTTGDGTAGTADLWRRNIGRESDPVGICRRNSISF
jgi:hypothetical protein